MADVIQHLVVELATAEADFQVSILKALKELLQNSQFIPRALDTPILTRLLHVIQNPASSEHAIQAARVLELLSPELQAREEAGDAGAAADAAIRPLVHMLDSPDVSCRAAGVSCLLAVTSSSTYLLNKLVQSDAALPLLVILQHEDEPALSQEAAAKILAMLANSTVPKWHQALRDADAVNVLLQLISKRLGTQLQASNLTNMFTAAASSSSSFASLSVSANLSGGISTSVSSSAALSHVRKQSTVSELGIPGTPTSTPPASPLSHSISNTLCHQLLQIVVRLQLLSCTAQQDVAVQALTTQINIGCSLTTTPSQPLSAFPSNVMEEGVVDSYVASNILNVLVVAPVVQMLQDNSILFRLEAARLVGHLASVSPQLKNAFNACGVILALKALLGSGNTKCKLAAASAVSKLTDDARNILAEYNLSKSPSSLLLSSLSNMKLEGTNTPPLVSPRSPRPSDFNGALTPRHHSNSKNAFTPEFGEPPSIGATIPPIDYNNMQPPSDEMHTPAKEAAVEALLEVVTSTTESLEHQEQAVLALMEQVNSNPHVVLKRVASASLLPQVAALLFHSDNTHCLWAGGQLLGAMRTVAQDSGMGSTATWYKAQETALTALSARSDAPVMQTLEATMPPVVDMLAPGGREGYKVQAMTLEAVSSMIVDEYKAGALAKKGLINMLVHLLASAQDVELTSTACKMLGDLVATHPAYAQDALRAGAISYLAALLSGSDPGTQGAAGRALVATLKVADSQGKDALIKSGLLKTLVQLLGSYHPAGREQAAEILSVLVAGDKSRQKAAVQAGAVQPLMALLSQESTPNAAAAAGAIACITLGSTSCQHAFATAGVIPVLVEHLYSPLPVSQRNAARALQNIAEGSGTRQRAVASAGGVEALTKLLNSTEVDVSDAATRALQAMSTVLCYFEGALYFTLPLNVTALKNATVTSPSTGQWALTVSETRFAAIAKLPLTVSAGRDVLIKYHYRASDCHLGLYLTSSNRLCLNDEDPLPDWAGVMCHTVVNLAPVNLQLKLTCNGHSGSGAHCVVHRLEQLRLVMDAADMSQLRRSYPNPQILSECLNTLASMGSSQLVTSLAG